jgi:hypothetical protein
LKRQFATTSARAARLRATEDDDDNIGLQYFVIFLFSDQLTSLLDEVLLAKSGRQTHESLQPLTDKERRTLRSEVIVIVVVVVCFALFFNCNVVESAKEGD